VEAVRRFQLDRYDDLCGVSGTGTVAEGVEFSDGTAVLRWLVELKSTAVYNNVDELIAIHGHEGSTLLRWIDQRPRGEIRNEIRQQLQAPEA
jgi:hypothetical protein